MIAIIGTGILFGIAVAQYALIRALKLDKEITESQLKETKAHFEIYRTYANSDISLLNVRLQDEIARNADLQTVIQDMIKKDEMSRYGNEREYRKAPKGTVEAVKYAMKHAHPDNGGDAEDFIRFKKCYEKLTRK